MWLLPYLTKVCTAAVRVYYRAERGGASIPSTGPVLLVGNHPNSLLDPAFLAWVAERPVRFLAKEPLFRDRLIGWLIRGSGSLPVYRASDDRTQMGKNKDTFVAVHEALGRGDAIAMFPEGLSHDDPSIAPLKTGAARIALGAVAHTGGVFPIIPVGLMFRDKEHFRTEAYAVVGEPLAWSDLAARADERAAVTELTARIDAAMRTVTLNLARWEDEAVIRTAEAVWAAERAVERSPAARVARLATATEMLARLRVEQDPVWEVLARDVRAHSETLHDLRLTPTDVRLDTRIGPALRWVSRRVSVRGVVQAVLAAVTAVLFWVPYRLTGIVAGKMSPSRDTLSTYRVLLGTALFAGWIIAASVVVGVWRGPLAGVITLLALPVVAVAGLYATEHWQETLLTAKRWLFLRRDDPRLAVVREQQAQLVTRLEQALADAERRALPR
jgi:1-acyl-sn-glycerol-3-phosphate acyltransferase